MTFSSGLTSQILSLASGSTALGFRSILPDLADETLPVPFEPPDLLDLVLIVLFGAVHLKKPLPPKNRGDQEGQEDKDACADNELLPPADAPPPPPLIHANFSSPRFMSLSISLRESASA